MRSEATEPDVAVSARVDSNLAGRWLGPAVHFFDSAFAAFDGVLAARVAGMFVLRPIPMFLSKAGRRTPHRSLLRPSQD